MINERASAYETIALARRVAREQPRLADRSDLVATLRATASSQNIEGGDSTPLTVARSVGRDELSQ